MERADLWWGLAGPSRFLGKIVKAVASGQRVICVAAASPRPSGLAEAISRAVSSDLSFEVVHHDLSRRDQTEATAHLLAEVLDVPAAEVASVADFASHSDLVDQVVIIDGIDRKHLRRWSLFLRHLNSQANTSSVVGPVLIVMLPNGLSRDEYLEISGGRAISTLGISDRYDSVGYVAGIGIRPSDDLPARVGHAVVLDVAAWSRECLERMCVWDVVDQIEPLTLLQRAAESVEYPYPCWENGLVDRWDDEPVAHAFAAARHGLTDHLKRRIWSGQASVLLPFTFRILRATIARYLDVLERSVSPSRPLVKNYHGREKWIVDPWELEFHDVRIFAQHIMPRVEVDMLKIAGAVRNAVAHHNILDADRIGRLSDHYEANRHLHEGDVPGWNWPRCGQAMTLTVGPSGAGKSTWSAAQGIDIVSSDDICAEVSARADLPGDQSALFREVRHRSARILFNGRDVIVDAMHVETEHRLRQVGIAPPDVAVRYAVIDRPLSEKQRDAGWRASKGIVERYHSEFASQISAVLSGDGQPRITVHDLRTQISE